MKNRYIIIALAVLGFAGGWLTYSSRDAAPDLAPFFPTPMNIVDEMLKMASVSSKDVVYDLGCGDGRIVVTAADRFGAKGVGVEYDPQVAQLAVENVEKQNLGHLVQIVIGDATKIDASPASVVMLYLLPDTISRLRPGLESSLKPGSRVVSHNAEMPGWQPSHVRRFDDGTGRVHTLYLYEIGRN